MYECLPACLPVYHCVGAGGGQKKAPDRLELELQVAVSCHVDAGAEQNSQCSNL